jgi:carboxyl-terminal processing protease
LYRSPRRSPLVPILAVLAPVLLVLGIWLGGHPDRLPDKVRDWLVSDDQAQVYQEAADIIERDYYRKIDADDLLNSSLSGAIEHLHDRFSNYFDPKAYKEFLTSTSGSFSGIGTNVQEDPKGLKVVSVFDRSPAKRAGLKPGDVIVAVNGKPLAGKPSAYSTSLIQGEPGTGLTLTVLRDGRRFQQPIKRAKVDVPVVASRLKTVDGKKLADVRLASFTSGAHGELRDAIDKRLKQGAKGIVLDLRGNGGGLLDEAVLVGSIFIPEGTIVSTKGRNRPRHVFKATGNAISSKVPVEVLVDRGTASAAEIVAGALQDRKRAKVIGTRTFGKGVFQEIEELSNGGALDITVGEYFLPSGRNLGGGGVKQGAGIQPDETARDDPKTRTRDEALDAALRRLAAQAQ